MKRILKSINLKLIKNFDPKTKISNIEVTTNKIYILDDQNRIWILK